MIMSEKRGGGGIVGSAYKAVTLTVSSIKDVRVKKSRSRRKRANAQPMKAPMKRFQQKFPAMFPLIAEARLPIPSA